MVRNKLLMEHNHFELAHSPFFTGPLLIVIISHLLLVHSVSALYFQISFRVKLKSVHRVNKLTCGFSHYRHWWIASMLTSASSASSFLHGRAVLASIWQVQTLLFSMTVTGTPPWMLKHKIDVTALGRLGMCIYTGQWSFVKCWVLVLSWSLLPYPALLFPPPCMLHLSLYWGWHQGFHMNTVWNRYNVDHRFVFDCKFSVWYAVVWPPVASLIFRGTLIHLK